MFIFLFPGSRVTTDQRVVAKQEIQEVEPAKRAGTPYSHHRYQARDTNTKLPHLTLLWVVLVHLRELNTYLLYADISHRPPQPETPTPWALCLRNIQF